MVLLPNSEKDYSDFIGFLSNASHIFSIFAGFTLTVLVLFITRVPDPSPMLIQVTLFLLCFILDLFIFLLAWISGLSVRYIREIPPYTKGMVMCSFSEYLGISLFGVVATLLFVSYNLVLLASASFAMFIVSLVLRYFYIMKPQMETRRKRSGQ